MKHRPFTLLDVCQSCGPGDTDLDLYIIVNGDRRPAYHFQAESTQLVFVAFSLGSPRSLTSLLKTLKPGEISLPLMLEVCGVRKPYLQQTVEQVDDAGVRAPAVLILSDGSAESV